MTLKQMTQDDKQVPAPTWTAASSFLRLLTTIKNPKTQTKLPLNKPTD